MTESKIAQPRLRYVRTEPERGILWWKRPLRDVFALQDGTEFVVEGPGAASEALINLAHDYIELGNTAADLKMQWQGEEREARVRYEELLRDHQALKDRVDAAPDAEKLVPRLSADLEKSLNWVIRFAQSLGIQAQGPLYDELHAMLNRYGMEYRPPTRLDMMREAVLQPGEYRDEVLTASFDPTGKMNMIEQTIDSPHAAELAAGERRWLLEEGHHDDDGDPS